MSMKKMLKPAGGALAGGFLARFIDMGVDKLAPGQAAWLKPLATGTAGFLATMAKNDMIHGGGMGLIGVCGYQASGAMGIGETLADSIDEIDFSQINEEVLAEETDTMGV